MGRFVGVLVLVILPLVAVQASESDLFANARKDYESGRCKVYLDVPERGEVFSKSNFLLLLMSDIVSYLTSDADTVAKSIVGDFESYSIGRSVNPDFEELYYRAKRDDIAKLMREDLEKFNARTSGLEAEMERLSKLAPNKGVDSILLSVEAREAGETLRFLQDKYYPAMYCHYLYALNGEESSFTREIARYKARLDQRALYNSVKRMDKAIDSVKEINKVLESIPAGAK